MRQARTIVVIGALLTVGLLVGGLAVGIPRTAPPSAPSPSSTDRPAIIGSTMPAPPPGTTGRLAYSHDGDIYIAATDGSDPRLVAEGTPSQDGFYEPTWSPDGRFLAYQGQAEDFYVVDADGRPIAAGEGCCVAWSPDSTRLSSAVGFAGSSDRPDAPVSDVALIVSRVDGSVSSRITLPGATLGNIVRTHWTPDGRSVVVSRVAGAPRGARTWIVPLDGTAPGAYPIEPAYAAGAGSIFSPDGTRVVGVVAGRFVIATMDGSIMWLIDHHGDGTPVSPTWSPNGRQIAIGNGTGFAVVDVATREIRSIWTPPSTADDSQSYGGYVTDWSAESTRVLVETYDPASSGLWSVPIDGSDPRRLVEGDVTGGSWQHLPPT